MKSIFKTQFIVAFVLGALFLASCSNENEGIFTPEEETKYQLVVVPTKNADSLKLRKLEVVAAPGTLVTVDVNFKGDKKMRRLYMTKNNLNTTEGPQAFEYPLGSKKSDGSINLDGNDKTEFKFQFKFPAPAKNGEAVQYVLWTTNNRGDFRDISDSNSIADDAYGTITIKADANAAVDTDKVRAFSGFFLKAPLGDSSSETFMSVFNSTKYKISEADEVVKLWDFGYYYGQGDKASFASAAAYPAVIIDIKKLVGTTAAAQLNKFYFKLSSKTSAEFDAISKNSDLNFIEGLSKQSVTGIKKGNIIEFVDSYNNKGMMRITDLVEGAGSNGKITFDVKVQTRLVPVKQIF